MTELKGKSNAIDVTVAILISIVVTLAILLAVVIILARAQPIKCETIPPSEICSPGPTMVCTVCGKLKPGDTCVFSPTDRVDCKQESGTTIPKYKVHLNRIENTMTIQVICHQENT